MLGGDFNIDISCGSLDECGRYVLDFLCAYSLSATYDLYQGRCFASYYSQSSNSHSLLDYVFTSAPNCVTEVDVAYLIWQIISQTILRCYPLLMFQ